MKKEEKWSETIGRYFDFKEDLKEMRL